MRTADNIGLDEALDDYALTKRGGYEPSTWQAHDLQLEKMRKWLISETHPRVLLSTVVDPDCRYMERYFNKMRPPQYAEGSFNNYRGYINMFWKYCVGEAWIRVNPMRHIDPLQVKRQPKLGLSVAELIQMLEGAEPHDRIALAVGMNTALRAGDIYALKVGAVDFHTKTISVYIRKTKTWDEIAITQDLLLELLRWLGAYAEATNVGVRDLPNDWYLIPPRRGWWDNPRSPDKKLCYRYEPLAKATNAARVVHKALLRIGITETKGEGFHTLRRGAARVVYELAKDDGHKDPIRIAQELLGHKDRSTTELYLSLKPEKIARDGLMRGKGFISAARALERGAVSDVAGENWGQRSA